MADEYSKPPYNRPSNIPPQFNWESLVEKRGVELEEHYVKLLRELGKAGGMLGEIFYKAQKQYLKFQTFRGWEIVPSTYRLALMNMFLHNIGDMESEPSISRNDSLISDTGERFDYVLANPPFGKKSSMTITNTEGKQQKEDLTYNRQDFWATTSNHLQLDFSSIKQYLLVFWL